MAYQYDQHEDLTELRVPNLNSLTSVPRPLISNGNGQIKNKLPKKQRSPHSATNGTSGGTGEQRYDARYKVLLLGNSGVGKTSILRALMREPFNPGTISTIGIDLGKRIFTVENNRIQLEIWDTAGQEQYYSIVALHFREAKAFIVVYDVTDSRSFDQIRKYWLKSVDEHMDEPVPVFFAGNKADLTAKRQVALEDGDKLASQQCAHGHFETSAKSGLNIDLLFQRVAESMVSTWGAPKRWYEVENGRNWPNQMREKQTVNLNDPSEPMHKSQCCRLK